MDGRESKGASPADLLVCFPSRAHLSLMMPKPICGPAKPSEPTKRRHHHHHHHHHHHFNKSSNRGPGGAARPTESEIAEPTSPRVSCAGKIKVRPKHGSCKNWQSVMEEIERLHNHRRRKKRANTAEVFGFKREIVHFLSCLRQVRFDFRCFRAFLATDLSSDDDEEEDEDYQEKKVGFDGNESSGTEFSWFVALQEEQSKRDDSQKEETFGSASGPPPNALSLMRCRSAPAKSWLENEGGGGGGGGGGKEREDGGGGGDGEAEREEGKLEEKRNKTLAMLMREDADFCTFSSEIAKETWVVGDLRDLLVPRSRSWKI